MLRGWDELAASVRQLADDAGAQSIWTSGNYQLTGELFFHGQAARDPRPVRDLKRAERYDFVPPAERYPQLFPGILVLPGEPKAEAGSPYFDHAEPLGTIYRGTGRASEAYTVYAVSAPTADFPVAD